MVPKFCCDVVKSACVADKICDLFANVPEEIHRNDQVFVSFWPAPYVYEFVPILYKICELPNKTSLCTLFDKKCLQLPQEIVYESLSEKKITWQKSNLN